MPKFRISSHGRLQDWIAAEKGFFEEESLDYEIDVRALENSAQDIAADAHQDIRTGAYELYLSGADTDPLDVERYFRALKTCPDGAGPRAGALQAPLPKGDARALPRRG